MFFVIPVVAVVFGSLALIYQNRTRKYLKRRSLARGMTMARIGLFTGVIAIFIGSSTAAGYYYLSHERKAKMTMARKPIPHKDSLDTLSDSIISE